MPESNPVRGAATWIAMIVVTFVAAAALTACSAEPSGGETDPTASTQVIRAGLGIDGVAYVGDPKDGLPGGIDDVEVV